ncbi:MAG: hypothetical protein ACP5QY_07235, partial [Candidatus Hydrogenedens sp.]
MKKNVIKLNKIPLMGWISLVVFASILSLLLLGSFTKVKADSNAGTGMIPAITATECATEQTSPGTRALNPMT